MSGTFVASFESEAAKKRVEAQLDAVGLDSQFADLIIDLAGATLMAAVQTCQAMPLNSGKERVVLMQAIVRAAAAVCKANLSDMAEDDLRSLMAEIDNPDNYASPIRDQLTQLGQTQRPRKGMEI